MATPSLEQRFALLAALGLNMDWNAVTAEQTQVGIGEAQRAGAEFTRFVQNGCRMSALTPTTYGEQIQPPFNGAELIADGPGDEDLDVANIALLPILKADDGPSISFEEAANRSVADPATNWGQRAAFKVHDAGNAGKISEKIWPVGAYAVFGKTRWRGRGGDCYAWYVIRGGSGFGCGYCWFTRGVDSRGRVLVCRK